MSASVVPAQKRDEWMGLMIDATNHIAQIVDGVRTFGRPTPFELRPTPALQPLQRAGALVAPELGDAGVDVAERFDAELPSIHANSERLQQVFINLLVNACDALVDGGVTTPRIVVSAAVGDGVVLFSVSDNGPGVAAAHRDQVFEPFFTTKEVKGTGLGLSVSAGIVREHHGAIALRENADGGSTFVVSIPIDGAG